MADELTLTLNSPITEEQFDMIADYDFDHTNEIIFHTKHGKEVKFVKASAQPEIVRCRDCEHRNTDECPMYYEEWIEYDEGDGFIERDSIPHDRTVGDGFCFKGERREDE